MEKIIEVRKNGVDFMVKTTKMDYVRDRDGMDQLIMKYVKGENYVAAQTLIDFLEAFNC